MNGQKRMMQKRASTRIYAVDRIRVDALYICIVYIADYMKIRLSIDAGTKRDHIPITILYM